ncbi:MAG: ribonuclease HIII [Planctomycetes bacterium]|nr:ribonuclease HIII [Planctomycetota bacterium]
MAQETLVLRVDPARAAALRARLSASTFDFRPVPHALFSVKGAGVVATLYASGKLVVQGENPERFVEQWVEGGVRQPAKQAPRESPASKSTPSGVALVGSDECGKGDYFGPLVVCAVRLEPAQTEELRRSEVRDSKTLSDEACRRLGAALRSRYEHAIEALEPPDYNSIYKRPGQLNQMLADLHARAIRRLAHPGDHALVDKFADERLIASRLADLDLHLEQRVRAESEPAVAAASVIAREHFLEAMKRLSDEAGVTLAKGAGDPTDRAAREYVRLHGFGGLSKVAKLHFKNTQKLQQRGF